MIEVAGEKKLEKEVKHVKQLLVPGWERRRKVRRWLLWKKWHEDQRDKRPTQDPRTGTRNPADCKWQLHPRSKRGRRG